MRKKSLALNPGAVSLALSAIAWCLENLTFDSRQTYRTYLSGYFFSFSMSIVAKMMSCCNLASFHLGWVTKTAASKGCSCSCWVPHIFGFCPAGNQSSMVCGPMEVSGEFFRLPKMAQRKPQRNSFPVGVAPIHFLQATRNPSRQMPFEKCCYQQRLVLTLLWPQNQMH